MKPVKFKIVDGDKGFKVILNGIKYPRNRGKLYLKNLYDIPLHPTKDKALEHAIQDYFSDNKERDNIIRDIFVDLDWNAPLSGIVKRL